MTIWICIRATSRLDDEQHKEYRKGLKELIADEGKLRAVLRSLQHDVENDPNSKQNRRLTSLLYRTPMRR